VLNETCNSGKLFVDLSFGNEGCPVKKDAVSASQRLDLT
jgi:hypothetical protein